MDTTTCIKCMYDDIMTILLKRDIYHNERLDGRE